MGEKHSAVCYIFREGAFTPVQETKPLRNDFGLDLFQYKGAVYYKLLPEDVKVEVDAFVAILKENNEYIRNLVQDYVESKTRLAMLYDTDPTHIKEQQEKAVAEADKLIANKILDVIRTMLCKDREVQSFEYTEARKAYFTEQMICEILIALEQAAMSFDMERHRKNPARQRGGSDPHNHRQYWAVR